MMALKKSYTPMDGLDINRAFPGSLKGTLTEVLAYKLFNDFILKSDYHVDLRGGELTESHLQHTIFLQIGKEIDKVTEEMAKIFGLKYCLPSRPDIPHTSPRTLIYEAMTHGVNSIISESGIGYNTQPSEEEVNGHVKGVMNLLKYLNMKEGVPEKPKKQQYLIADRPLVNAPLPGIFKAYADQNDLVRKNQVIGIITDIDNEVLSEIISPCDAVVHEMIPGRIVYTGDQLYRLAKIGESTGYSKKNTN
jgi:predicted deacylase